ncbi:hypothetical protein MCOR25_010814 [Pyricularia grisea]|nr:hypothetical protein MCOR25_010814 [Pyricularia grisea]
MEGVRSAFELGNGIIFENHPHAISDLAEDVVCRATPLTPPATPNHSLDLNRLRPDQICVYRSNNTGSERRTMIYISKYRPPHKLTAAPPFWSTPDEYIQGSGQPEDHPDVGGLRRTFPVSRREADCSRHYANVPLHD